MGKLLDGKVALVTGGGRGIGREESLALAHAGAKVVVNDLGGSFDGTGGTAEVALSVVEEIRSLGGEAVANAESVADFEGARRMIKETIDTFGDLNIVVNNAGILRDGMIFNMSEEDWDTVFSVHVKGTFAVTRHAADYWRREHKNGRPVYGRVINTSSDSGLLGNPGQSNYGAAKAAIASFSWIVDREMRKYGVSVNTIVPVARTRLTVDATPASAALMENKRGKDGFDVFAPANIAPIVVWLASDDAKDVHGQIFRVGGRRVWILQPHRSVASVKSDSGWEAEALGAALQGELAGHPIQRERIADIFESDM